MLRTLFAFAVAAVLAAPASSYAAASFFTTPGGTVATAPSSLSLFMDITACGADPLCFDPAVGGYGLTLVTTGSLLFTSAAGVATQGWLTNPLPGTFGAGVSSLGINGGNVAGDPVQFGLLLGTLGLTGTLGTVDLVAGSNYNDSFGANFVSLPGKNLLTIIPEPGTAVLLGTGLSALAFLRRRRKA